MEFILILISEVDDKALGRLESKLVTGSYFSLEMELDWAGAEEHWVTGRIYPSVSASQG